MPLDPCRGLSRWSSLTFSRLDHCQCRTRAVDWVLQANTPAASHCVHCAGLHSSMTHGIGSVTDIPHLCSGVNSSMMFHHYHLHSHKSSNVSNKGKSEHLLQPHRLTEQLQLRSELPMSCFALSSVTLSFTPCEAASFCSLQPAPVEVVRPHTR